MATLTIVSPKNTTNSRSTNVRPGTIDALDRMAKSADVARAKVAADLLVVAGRATPVVKVSPAPDRGGNRVPVKFRVQPDDEPYVDLGPIATGMDTCAWRTAILAVAEDPEKAVEEARAFLRQIRAVARFIRSGTASTTKGKQL